MVKAIIVTHGRIGEEYLNSLKEILGKVEEAVAISNSGLSLEDLRSEIGAQLEGCQEAVIFADFSGSTYIAAKIAAGKFPIICGFNLPMLLSFFTKRGELSGEKLLQTLITDGNRGMKLEGG
jgi:D-glucosaminate-specific PTS system IIA component